MVVSTQVKWDHFPRYGRKHIIFQTLKTTTAFWIFFQPMNPAPVVKNSTRWKLDLAWFCHFPSTRTGNISAIQFPAGILKKFTILSYHVQPFPQQVLMVFSLWFPNWFLDFAGEQASLRILGLYKSCSRHDPTCTSILKSIRVYS